MMAQPTDAPEAARETQVMKRWWVATRALIDAQAPAARHLPSVAGVLLALAAIRVINAPLATVPVWMWAGVCVTLVIEIIALLARKQLVGSRWSVVLPFAAVLALGLFRVGTGGSQSIFAALLLLPLGWLAADYGRRSVNIAIGFAFVMLLLPFVLRTEQWTGGGLVQVFFGGTVFALIAVIVNELASRSRSRLARLARLSDERDEVLNDAEVGREELARTEEQLRETEAFANSIWDAFENEAVIVTDLEGSIIAWGPGARRLLGYGGGMATRLASAGSSVRLSALGAPDHIADLIAPNPLVSAEDIAQGRVHVLERLVSIGGSMALGDGDLVLVSDSGLEQYVFLSCSERRNADGDSVGYTFVAREASYAREVARVKDEFVGTISHELRTPLSSILGYLELIADEDERLSDDQRRFLTVAERNAKRLLHLVGDLLFIAQVEAGKLPMEFADTDISAIAAASAESIAPIASAAGVTVDLILPEESVHARADAGRIGQAFDNLVSNAVKFTPRGGTVTISVDTGDDDVVFAVSDTGMGIAPEDLAQLSERFFRSKLATRQAIKGVGLGLSITKAIVGSHGGTLSASSVLGEGATFEIRLPAHAS